MNNLYSILEHDKYYREKVKDGMKKGVLRIRFETGWAFWEGVSEWVVWCLKMGIYIGLLKEQQESQSWDLVSEGSSERWGHRGNRGQVMQSFVSTWLLFWVRRLASGEFGAGGWSKLFPFSNIILTAMLETECGGVASELGSEQGAKDQSGGYCRWRWVGQDVVLEGWEVLAL